LFQRLRIFIFTLEIDLRANDGDSLKYLICTGKKSIFKQRFPKEEGVFMKHALQVFCILFVGFSGLVAEPWKIDLNMNLTTALNTYSDNWTGGEAGSFTWATQFLGVAERQLNPKLNTKATLKLQFGQTATQDKTSKAWSVPKKSTDLIDGEELLRLTLGAFVDPFVSVRAISEFLDESDTLLKRYCNPLELTEAVGASRTLKKSETLDWSSRLGGALRQVINRNHLDTATGARKTDVTSDGGVEIDMDLKATNTAKWVTLLSSLRLYEALASSKADSAGNWRYPHMKWENALTITFAKYLMLNVMAYAYFDKDIKDDFRLKETLSAGLTYIYSKK